MSDRTRKDVRNEEFVRGFQGDLRERGYSLRPDGIAGTRTRAAQRRLLLRSEPPWPQDTDEALEQFYGPRGDERWLVYVEPWWPMVAAWDYSIEISRIRIHQKCATSLILVFQRLASILTHEEIVELGLDRFGGTFNVRRMRGGSSWSRHSWGIAIDLDPRRNTLRSRWPEEATMDIRVIEAFESEGWKSYARVRGLDAMHFQATR